MRITALKVQEFRCFQEETVDLSSDITVVYGRNGTGKTCLFDAIEFALFGSVARLEAFRDTADPLTRLGAISVPRVQLTLAEGPDPIRIDASWDQETRSAGPIAGTRLWANHRDLLFGLLVDRDALGSRREVTAVHELFRATLMLSQDSIRTFVEADPDTRARVVAKLAGLAHIQRSKDKADSVLELAHRNIESVSTELDATAALEQELAARIADITTRVKARRSQLSGPRPLPEALAAAAASANIDFDPAYQSTQPPPEILADLRIRAEEQLRQLDMDTRRLSLLQSSAGSHKSRIGRLHEIDTELAEARRRVEASTAAIAQARAQTAALRHYLGELTGQSESLSADLQRLRRIGTILSHINDLDTSQAAPPIASLTDAHLAATRHLADTVRSRAEAIAATDRATLRLSALRARSYQLEALHEQSLRYSTLSSELSSATARLTALDSSLAALDLSIEQETSATLASQLAVRSAADALSRLSAASEEQVALLSRLRAYATSNICPLCNTSHASNASLQQSIDNALRGAPALLQRAAETDAATRTALARQESSLATFTQQRLALLQERRNLVATLADINHERQTTEADARRIDAPIAPEDLFEQIRTLRRDVTEQEELVRQSDRHLATATDSFQKAQALAQSAQRQLTEARLKQKEIAEQLGSLQHELTNLVSSTEGAFGLQQLEQKTRTVVSDLQTVGSKLTDTQASLQLASSTEREQAEHLTAAEHSLNRLEEEKGRVRGDLEVFRRRWRDFGLTGDPSDDDLSNMSRGIRLRVERASRVRDLAQTIEAGLEIDALAANTESLESEHAACVQNTRALRERLAALRKAELTAASWVGPLAEHLKYAVARTVARHQVSIERHFKAMIPSPHLFDGINMAHVGDRLDIGIRYRGHRNLAGEPRIFLSNAQLNVLALSIFMSLGSNQQWSRLKVLLLDDPVQHLDDLDVVAFLDTLRAVALGRFGTRRQILVSTCDRNVYRLMIQKFRPIEASGARFTAISLAQSGVSGPHVQYDVGGPNERRDPQSA